MISDDRVARLVEQRIQQAIERDLPRLLINLFHYNHVESWSQWTQTFPRNVPVSVESAKELEHTAERITTEVLFGNTRFVFDRFKVGEDPSNDSYTYSYWAYEIRANERVVFGIEAKHHWAGGKPEVKEISAYVPGAWEGVFKALKSECEELARKEAAETTAEKRQRNPPALKEQLRQQQIKTHLERFGLDEDGV